MMIAARSRGRWLACVAVALSLALAACDADDSTLTLHLRGSTTAQDGLSGLRIQLLGRELTIADFEVGADPLTPSVPSYHTTVPNDGALTISIELVQAGSTVARGDVRLDMHENWEWGVDILRTATDPTVGCFGCLGDGEFLIDSQFQNEPGEAVWLIWGGQERGSNVVY